MQTWMTMRIPKILGVWTRRIAAQFVASIICSGRPWTCTKKSSMVSTEQIQLSLFILLFFTSNKYPTILCYTGPGVREELERRTPRPNEQQRRYVLYFESAHQESVCPPNILEPDGGTVEEQTEMSSPDQVPGESAVPLCVSTECHLCAETLNSRYELKRHLLTEHSELFSQLFSMS